MQVQYFENFAKIQIPRTFPIECISFCTAVSHVATAARLPPVDSIFYPSYLDVENVPIKSTSLAVQRAELTAVR